MNRDKPKDNSDDKLCVEIPLLCRGGQLNPLNYDTIGFQIKLNAKLGGGLEVNPLVLYWDGDDFRNFRLKEMAVGLGSSLEVSAGASLELFGGASLIGTDGSVLDQRGIGPLTVNAGGCIEAIAGCGKVSGSYSLEKQRLTYIEYSGGTGAGGDLSFGETITHLWFYKDKNNLWLNIPGFAPQNLPTTANPNP